MEGGEGARVISSIALILEIENTIYFGIKNKMLTQ